MRASYPTYKSTSIPWLPEMPEHWDALKAKHIFKERSEKGYPDEPLLAATQTKGVVRKEEYETRTVTAQKDFHLLKLVKEEDFVISLRSFQGGIEYAYHRGIISPAYTIFYERNKVPVNKAFYRHLFKSHPFINSLTLFVTGIREGQNIDYAEFKDSLLPFPPLPEQTAIANYLDAKTEQINRFIAKKEKLIALLKEQKQAVINELLEDKEGKWERRKLKYVGRMINGYAFNSEEFLTEGSIKVIKIANIQPMKMDWTEKSFIPESYFEKQKQFSVKHGDLVFALTRPIIKEGIKVAFIDSDEKLLVNQRNAILKPRKSVTKDWLYYCFLTSLFISEFDKQIDKTGQQPNIATEDIGNIKIPFPKLNIQEEVVATIKQETYKIDAVIRRIERELDKVQELKQSLIAEVVTGRIKVA